MGQKASKAAVTVATSPPTASSSASRVYAAVTAAESLASTTTTTASASASATGGTGGLRRRGKLQLVADFPATSTTAAMTTTEVDYDYDPGPEADRRQLAFLNERYSGNVRGRGGVSESPNDDIHHNHRAPREMPPDLLQFLKEAGPVIPVPVPSSSVTSRRRRDYDEEEEEENRRGVPATTNKTTHTTTAAAAPKASASVAGAGARSGLDILEMYERILAKNKPIPTLRLSPPAHTDTDTDTNPNPNTITLTNNTTTTSAMTMTEEEQEHEKAMLTYLDVPVIVRDDEGSLVGVQEYLLTLPVTNDNTTTNKNNNNNNKETWNVPNVERIPPTKVILVLDDILQLRNEERIMTRQSQQPPTQQSLFCGDRHRQR